MEICHVHLFTSKHFVSYQVCQRKTERKPWNILFLWCRVFIILICSEFKHHRGTVGTFFTFFTFFDVSQSDRFIKYFKLCFFRLNQSINILLFDTKPLFTRNHHSILNVIQSLPECCFWMYITKHWSLNFVDNVTYLYVFLVVVQVVLQAN